MFRAANWGFTSASLGSPAAAAHMNPTTPPKIHRKDSVVCMLQGPAVSFSTHGLPLPLPFLCIHVPVHKSPMLQIAGTWMQQLHQRSQIRRSNSCQTDCFTSNPTCLQACVDCSMAVEKQIQGWTLLNTSSIVTYSILPLQPIAGLGVYTVVVYKSRKQSSA